MLIFAIILFAITTQLETSNDMVIAIINAQEE